MELTSNPAASAALNYALTLAKANQKQEAYRILSGLVTSYPNDTSVLLWMAFTCQNKAEARYLLDRVAQLDPTNNTLPQAYQWSASLPDLPLNAGSYGQAFNPAPPQSAPPPSQTNTQSVGLSMSFTYKNSNPPAPQATPIIVQPVTQTIVQPPRPNPLEEFLKTARPRFNEWAGRSWIKLRAFGGRLGNLLWPKKRGKWVWPLIIVLLLANVGLISYINIAGIETDVGVFSNTGTIQHLNYQVSAAEYSPALDRIILVSTNPNQLHILDPHKFKETVVNLNRAPLNLAVSPDGKFAAIGHTAQVSYVDLQTGAVVKTLDLSTDPYSIALAGNGWVYVSSTSDQMQNVYGIEIAKNRQVKINNAFGLYRDAVLKVGVDGKSLYAADNGLSPSKLHKIDISRGSPVYSYEFPYHGTHEGCGNLWMAEDGKRVFAACGEIYKLSPDRNQDMIYNGKLDGIAAPSKIFWLTHSQMLNRIFLVTGSQRYGGDYTTKSNSSNTIQVFQYDNLNFDRNIKMPNFSNNGKEFAAQVRAIFVSSAGNKVYSIVKADDNSGLLNDYGLVVNSFNPAGS